jgi:CheY-like chemotaxis protein
MNHDCSDTEKRLSQTGDGCPATLLCIHRDPVQLNLLKENGYGVITATNGSDGLRLLMAHAVDAIVLEYYLGLLDGGVVAHEIKHVRPQLPIVMLAECLELPDGALKSVDALVAKSDGPHFLLATIHSVLQTKQALQHDGTCAEQSNPPAGGTISKPSKRQILVVDDDKSVCEAVATLLMSAGYEVTMAEDGFSALLQLRNTLPEVVVSDLEMPKMSGYELLSVIRRRFPDILTVAMSGAYHGFDVPGGVVADSFFPKGECPKILLRTVEELLRSGSARSSSHHREFAPAWVPRNGNDSHGMPSVMLTCAECLRAFQVTVVEETTGQVLEIPCCFCPGISRYIIQPATHVMGAFIA